jgi:hypothetical protein
MSVILLPSAALVIYSVAFSDRKDIAILGDRKLKEEVLRQNGGYK